MTAEIVPLPQKSMGTQLREMANDPGSGYIAYCGAVVLCEAGSDLPVYNGLQEKCATTGMAQVLHFPRHLRRED